MIIFKVLVDAYLKSLVAEGKLAPHDSVYVDTRNQKTLNADHLASLKKYFFLV